MEEYSDLLAEQSILGAVILDSETFEDIKGIITPEDFYHVSNRLIFNSMIDIDKDNVAIDIVLLVENLKNKGLLEECGGISYLTKLSTIVPLPSKWKYYCDIVKNMSIKREIKLKLENILKNLKEKDMENIISDLENIKYVAEGVKSYSNLYTSLNQVNTQTKEDKLSTGFLRLDRVLNGLQVGTLCVLTGEPSTGKTTILNQIAAYNLSRGEKALIYSGELPQRKIKGWFVCTAADEKHIYDYMDEYGVTRSGVTAYGVELIDKWTKDKLFVFNDEGKPTLENLTGAIKSLHKETGARLIILDNLMTILADSHSVVDKFQLQTIIVSTLKNLAKKYNLVIILVAHASKKSSENRTPHMFDVSGASEISNLADYVLKLIRTISKSKETGEIINDSTVIWISKNRIEGEQGLGIKLKFDKRRRRFETEDRTELNVKYGYDENEKFEQIGTDDIPF